jgi:hypothetical protein
MVSEKYYSPSYPVFGMRCVVCGDIVDPIILMHRLSRDTRIPVSEGREDFIFLIRKYLGAHLEAHQPSERRSPLDSWGKFWRVCS